MRHALQGWLIVGLLLGTTAYVVAEQLTLTTYYPSPRGVYNELSALGNVQIGTIDAPVDPATAPQLLVVQADPAPAFRVEDEAGDASPFVIDADGNVTTGGTVTTSGTVTVGGANAVVRVPNGSAAAPAFTFAGDTNTGIFSNAPNRLRFATDGIQRLEIGPAGNIGGGNVFFNDGTFSGKVGVATASPTHSLTLGGTPGPTNGVKFPDGTVQTSAGLKCQREVGGTTSPVFGGTYSTSACSTGYAGVSCMVSFLDTNGGVMYRGAMPGTFNIDRTVCSATVNDNGFTELGLTMDCCKFR